jgi:hypothetical protein
MHNNEHMLRPITSARLLALARQEYAGRKLLPLLVEVRKWELIDFTNFSYEQTYSSYWFLTCVFLRLISQFDCFVYRFFGSSRIRIEHHHGLALEIERFYEICVDLNCLIEAFNGLFISLFVK